MNMALNEAKKGLKIGEVPIGAVMVMNGEVIAKSYNSPIRDSDPSAHAELKVIRKSGEKINNYRLVGADLYVTLEPCAMCYGAISHARLSNVFYGARDPNTGSCGTCQDFSKSKCFNHYPNIFGGILEAECSNLLKNFFRAKRN